MNVSYVPKAMKTLALVYLARGVEVDHLERFRRFVRSYRRVPAGVDHSLFVIFKGFADRERLRAGQEIFLGLDYQPLYTSDDSFDIGAYADAVKEIPHDRVCFVNTNSEVLCEGWLGKLAANLDQPHIGLVGATGSFESLNSLHPRFPGFPNVHIRSNAFMMDREQALKVLPAFSIRNKNDAFLAESGPEGLTRRIFDMGLSAVVVGRNGRGYPPSWWPMSQTFRQGLQSNLLVHDKVTRTFETTPWSQKKEMSMRTWGQYLFDETIALLPKRHFGNK